MKNACALVALAAAVASGQPTVWTGYDVSFSKPAGADPTLPENQDRITPEVWITRGLSRGIYNIRQEIAYQGSGTSGPSPVGTMWAFGTSDNHANLTFTTWAMLAAGSPPSLVGRNCVAHLVDEDIYLDVRFTSWDAGAGSGAFLVCAQAEPEGCAADLSGASDPNDPAYGVPDGVADSSDFFYYLDQFVAGNVEVADLTGASDPNDPSYGMPDGALDAADFFYYLDRFVEGCA